VLGSVGNWASNEVYPLQTAGLVSFAAAGAYRALQTVVAPVHVYLRTIDTYFAPRVAAAFDAGGRAALLRSLRRIFALVLVPVAGVVAVASLWPAELLQLFFRETYVGFAAGLPFLAVFYLTWSLYAPLQMAFRAIRVTRPIFRAHAAAAAAMFTLGVLAIRRWGLYGALGGQTLNAAISGVILLGAWWAWRKGSLREKTEAAPAAGVEV
jgi:O-antigen/teichoic acid export membrane protein